MRNGERRERAFEQFKKVAAGETRDFVYNMAYRRLIPQFSTAPQSETEMNLKLIEDAAKLGHAELVELVGSDLYNWAQDNGYRHS